MRLDKSMMTYSHHYGIVRRIFTALAILCALTIPFSPPLAITDLFIVFTVLPFPEFQIAGIMYYLTFSDPLLSLNNMHLRLLRSFPGLVAHLGEYSGLPLLYHMWRTCLVL